MLCLLRSPLRYLCSMVQNYNGKISVSHDNIWLLVLLINCPICTSFFASSSTNNSPTSVFSVRNCKSKTIRPCEVNFHARYKFGNIRKQGINICHWNKGSGYMFNKIEEIEYLVSSFKPHILGISEANFWKHQSRQMYNLKISMFILLNP